MNYYVEISNAQHGGGSWGLGQLLWSPADNKWNDMNQPDEGDLIIHTIKETPTTPHRLWGVSVVDEKVKVTDERPPIPGRWKDYNEYYVIPLRNFVTFNKKVLTQDFLSDNEPFLRSEVRRSFYTDRGEIKVVQKYIRNLPEEVFNEIKNYMGPTFEEAFKELKDLEDMRENTTRPGNQEEILTTENEETKRVTTTVSRIVRDTKLIKNLKKEYKDVCQICGKRIKKKEDRFYSEGHHVKPLGGVHQGPDTADNVVILCPNHHIEFELGVIAISMDNFKIIHADEDSKYHNKKLNYTRKDLSKEYLKYHLEKIFKA